ncbi:MAG: hypothetical protein K9I74_12305 [Bacteroidales bacterium]|nr:hypothetical protein [Bacteroidales bacterium]
MEKFLHALVAGIRKDRAARFRAVGLPGRFVFEREVIMDQNIKQRINEAETYREKAILYLLLAFDDDNDERIKHVYENIKLISQGGQS